MVSDVRGDVHAGRDEPAGLFYRDMRHLSHWTLLLNGRPLEALHGEAVEYDEAVFYLEESTGTVYRNPTVSVLRHRCVGEGVQERLEITNHGTAAVAIEVSLQFDADFADIFEVKDKVAKTGHTFRRVSTDHVTLGYERADFRRETRVHGADAFHTAGSLHFQVDLQPGGRWCRQIDITVATQAGRVELKRERRPNLPVSLDAWIAGAPELETDSDDLRRTYRRSLVDLAALRFFPDIAPNASLPAAGLPWYMALFGRDSLIISFQALPFLPELARTTLRTLAARQAQEVDDFRDAEPGKILHELRHGELTHVGERPQSPYYGSADATPLFLIVLDEYERWTGDTDTVRELEPAARAAVRWMEEFGDRDGDGFIEYAPRNPDTGLVNHCWKDSWNSILHPDGRLASLPRATCEIQGYAYDARRRTARLAREVWRDDEFAERLERDADRLFAAFQQAYWLADQCFYVLALDGSKQPVRTLTSNMGHLLWSGMVAAEHAPAVASHLMGERMFSGWGVRTLATGQPAYNPVEYHNGTVWPHDNAFIAAGLARYGCTEQAARIAWAVLEAAAPLGFRLPEALVGADRADTRVPVPYPSACSPQGWASGTPLLLIRTLLGMETTADGLWVNPTLPPGLRRLALRGVPTRNGRADVG
ncbi:glycogen debranching N-terminal domain-containing protein [Krasilnikovia sp. M28-CT-15]